MANVMTLNTEEGNVKLDSEKLLKLNQRAHNILEEISELEKDFKEIVEEAAIETGIKKGKIGSYFKERFKFKTKDTKAKGELFCALDEMLDK